ncbi:MtrAB system histidine kinase MtrB [Nocardioides sp. GCM10027113]|uniref:MtrAB system histidine kinase MtrB n=1 Tax=unclassified Nocardioides TaxID=2615069 RepID=UPI00361C14F8
MATPRADDPAGDSGTGRSLPAAVRRALTFWRRSIQARVVASTVLLSALVVSAVGWFLLQQTREGLLSHRVEAVVAEANNETAQAREQLGAAGGTDVDVGAQQRALVEPIIVRGNTRGFGVVMAGPVGEESSRIADGGAKFTQGLDRSSVPESLEEHFSQRAPTAWTYTEIRSENSRGETVVEPGVVVGSQVRLPADGELYTLYYLFPLSEEEETLALVARALLTAAVLLLVLVAGLTWLVTRQVVTPIRMARKVAERLAAGQLQQRLRVSGEDDLARLATSFNQMATSLQRQIRQLEELSRVQRRFVSDVSHELRTPLTTVRMAGDVLHDAREDFDPATARAAELLQSELDRFETLLVDLLEISRFDAGAAVLDLDDVNLVDVAHRVAQNTRVLAEQRHTRVIVRSPDHPCLAEADVRRVERIVRNLVTNAIDHAERHDVVVHVAGDEHAAAIAVRDYGVGLGTGESAMVFNRFWRADPARARTSGGTGLGLSISLEDTHLHGGWLQAWGRPNEGAQFRLTLPRRAGDTLRQSPLPLVPDDAGTTPRTTRGAAPGAGEPVR